MSLYDYIENDNDLSNVEVQRLFKKIVTTIKGCFEAGVSHKDIKPENILLFREKSSGQLDIKVIDFGCGEHITSYKGTHTGGTRIYWPPEYIKGGKFLHMPATVWSLGTLLYYMVCRHDPFYTNASICRASPSFPKNVPNLCRDLIVRCFVTVVKSTSYGKIMGTQGSVEVRSVTEKLPPSMDRTRDSQLPVGELAD
ncbi:serine/threonine-protein kinase pim-2-like [Oratosquilla oratoria]|uniref:serine/threonine-protein kinase pim-2-like n=1 Tax=Oratosquilla oratoria TaxID=337810 RepID=UPI003F770060